MRPLLLALVLVVFSAFSTMGAINIQVVASKTSLVPGETTTISIQMQCTSNKAVGALGGTITGASDGASSLGSLTANNDFAWTEQFTAAISPVPGTPGDNGGMAAFGSQQAIPNDSSLGRGTWATVATYSVVAGQTPGQVVLTLTPALVGGFGPAKSVFGGSFDTTIGTNTPVAITIMPVPAMQTLLAIVNAWGCTTDATDYDASADLNSDGWVDVIDLLILVSNWA